MDCECGRGHGEGGFKAIVDYYNIIEMLDNNKHNSYFIYITYVDNI